MAWNDLMIGELLQFGSFSRGGSFRVSDLSGRKIYQKHLLLLGSRVSLESELSDNGLMRPKLQGYFLSFWSGLYIWIYVLNFGDRELLIYEWPIFIGGIVIIFDRIFNLFPACASSWSRRRACCSNSTSRYLGLLRQASICISIGRVFTNRGHCIAVGWRAVVVVRRFGF